LDLKQNNNWFFAASSTPTKTQKGMIKFLTSPKFFYPAIFFCRFLNQNLDKQQKFY